jgi:hypothetical protein
MIANPEGEMEFGSVQYASKPQMAVTAAPAVGPTAAYASGGLSGKPQLADHTAAAALHTAQLQLAAVVTKAAPLFAAESIATIGSVPYAGVTPTDGCDGMINAADACTTHGVSMDSVAAARPLDDSIASKGFGRPRSPHLAGYGPAWDEAVRTISTQPAGPGRAEPSVALVAASVDDPKHAAYHTVLPQLPGSVPKPTTCPVAALSAASTAAQTPSIATDPMTPPVSRQHVEICPSEYDDHPGSNLVDPTMQSLIAKIMNGLCHVSVVSIAKRRERTALFSAGLRMHQACNDVHALESENALHRQAVDLRRSACPCCNGHPIGFRNHTFAECPIFKYLEPIVPGRPRFGGLADFFTLQVDFLLCSNGRFNPFALVEDYIKHTATLLCPPLSREDFTSYHTSIAFEQSALNGYRPEYLSDTDTITTLYSYTCSIDRIKYEVNDTFVSECARLIEYDHVSIGHTDTESV